MTAASKEMTTTVAKSELSKVKLGSLVVDDDLNVRQTYNEAHIQSLATSIAKVGVTRPLTVSREVSGDKYTLLGGFCRVRAIKSLYPDSWQDVEVPVSIVVAKSPEELLQFNIGDDESAEPPKRSEVAKRLYYMVEEVGIKQSKLAEKTGLSQADVSKMVSVMKKLHPDILAEWEAAPTRAEEIPFALLYNWSQFKADAQLQALSHYKSPPLLDEEVEEEEEEPEAKPKRKPRSEEREIMHKVRTKKEVENELARYLDIEERTEAQEAVRKTLEWCLSERKTIRV